MPKSENKPPEETSRTSRKNEVHDLRKLGIALAALPPVQLAKMSLPDDLLELIRTAQSLKTHGAIKRHMQFVAKKIRGMDIEHIKLELDKLKRIDTKGVALFHETEVWRDKLLGNGDAVLKEFIAAHPHADSQKLRQLIRQTQKDISKEINTGSAKKLFNYLKELLKPGPSTE